MTTNWTPFKAFFFKVAAAAVYLLPMVIAHFPQYANITLGGVGIILVNWLENKILI